MSFLRLDKLTNGKLSWIIIGAIVVAMATSIVEPLATYVFIAVVCAVCGFVSFCLAKFIDWLDESVEIHVRMTRVYHLAFALGIATLAGVLFGRFDSVFPFSPELYAIVSPKVLLFVWGLVVSLCGYFIAWQFFMRKGA
ncbi:hypothetical protein HY947_02365 [Candidatus Gottesmanbacteria bacterium]|nr:hypothetical protein [Candidatus Gottesmanbacteria bacterium]